MKIFSIMIITAVLAAGCRNTGAPPEMAQPSSVNNTFSQTEGGASLAAILASEPAEGSITISQLFSDREKYNGNKVIVRGRVVKVNRAILNKNWIHIQDGTEYEGNSDLTITSDKDCNIGDIITVEGRIILNRDFGYGYYYDILMEDGNIIN